MMNNFIKNNTMDIFHIRFNSKYQLVIKYGLIKYGLPKIDFETNKSRLKLLAVIWSFLKLWPFWKKLKKSRFPPQLSTETARIRHFKSNKQF